MVADINKATVTKPRLSGRLVHTHARRAHALRHICSDTGRAQNKEEAGLSSLARSLSDKSSQITRTPSHANQRSHVHVSGGLHRPSSHHHTLKRKII